ncbi:MAG: site-2 protease family protein, partial [Pseudomonadota bacterium]|nr:site-2 protease family protein [Pseudomonadota bacterium]
MSIWAIPALVAITLHEVAHGWVARFFGDRTAQMLGRLSLNPLRHIDPVGTLVVPGLLLVIGGPLIGWAKPVPVATSVLPHPRRAMVFVALAGPAANLLMALLWCAVLGAIARTHGNATLVGWIALMAQAGIVVNVVLAVFNLLPIPPLDGGRVLAGLLPARWGTRLERIEPVGLFLVLGFSVMRWLDWLFEPAFRLIGRVVTVLV